MEVLFSGVGENFECVTVALVRVRVMLFLGECFQSLVSFVLGFVLIEEVVKLMMIEIGIEIEVVEVEIGIVGIVVEVVKKVKLIFVVVVVVVVVYLALIVYSPFFLV